MNNKSKKQDKRLSAIGSLVIFVLLGIQLTVFARQTKRSGAEIAKACLKKIPNANLHTAKVFITSACVFQYSEDSVKAQLCVQNGLRKFKELKAKKR